MIVTKVPLAGHWFGVAWPVCVWGGELPGLCVGRESWGVTWPVRPFAVPVSCFILLPICPHPSPLHLPLPHLPFVCPPSCFPPPPSPPAPRPPPPRLLPFSPSSSSFSRTPHYFARSASLPRRSGHAVRHSRSCRLEMAGFSWLGLRHANCCK